MLHLSIFISVFNQLDAQNLCHSKFCASSWLNTEINFLKMFQYPVPDDGHSGGNVLLNDRKNSVVIDGLCLDVVNL